MLNITALLYFAIQIMGQGLLFYAYLSDISTPKALGLAMASNLLAVNILSFLMPFMMVWFPAGLFIFCHCEYSTLYLLVYIYD